jgi:hypothetical protein
MGKKDFTTYDLKGKYVIVFTFNENVRYTGELLEIFESNGSIVLKDYTVMVKVGEEWVPKDRGDIIILTPKAYISIACPKLR